MFDGEKCVRCRRHFKFEELSLGPDGFSVCSECGAELESFNRQVLLCPNDGHRMKPISVQILVAAVCRHCGGLWIKGGELDVIDRQISHPYGAFSFIAALQEEAKGKSQG